MIRKFFSNRISRIAVLMGLLTASAAILFYCEQKDDDPFPVINEVCGNNFSVAADPNGDYSDYIEIYNPYDKDIDTDYYLSDSKKNLKKIKLDTPIAPGEYRIVWLSGGGDAPFNISKNGETLYLSTEGGRVVDAVAMPLLPYDVSFARVKDGADKFDTMTGTPGVSNDEAVFVDTELISEPKFSLEDGFYEEGTKLSLSSDLFTDIYYTEDGSEPTEGSKRYRTSIVLTDASADENIYANEIMYPTYKPPTYKVDKARVIKAVAINKITGEKSKVVSHVYFTGFEDKKEYEGVQIMSLVLDPEDLFGYDRGIYTLGKKYDEYKELGGFTDLPDDEVPGSFLDTDGTDVYRLHFTNSEYRGREWERPAVMTYFDENRDLLDRNDIGVRISGESTRFVFQKSLNLFARDIYSDESSFAGGFYEGEKKMRLRRGDNSMLYQEAFIHSVLEDMGIAAWKSRPCALFLNGEYWGVYTLREQYDADYFYEYYDIMPEDLNVIKNCAAEYGGNEAEEAYKKAIQELAYYNLSDDEIYSFVDGSIDLDNMIDYFCGLIFFDDEDIDPEHNQLLYRENTGRWKWAAYDLDVTCGDPEANTIEYYRGKGDDMYLPGCLYERAGFKDKLMSRMKELLATTLSYEELHKRIMEWDAIYRRQNIETIRRFDDPNYSEADHEKSLQSLDDYFKKRGDNVLAFLEEDLALYQE